MSDKNCPILLAKCRLELCPYYEEERIDYYENSWFHPKGCYETFSECTNPICGSRFNARMATKKDFKNHNMHIYDHELYKYAEGEDE